MTIRSVSDVPIENLVQSFLHAMISLNAKTCVVFLRGTDAVVAKNHADAEATARNLFTIKDGAIEAAAIALHAFRFVQGDKLDETMNRCSLHPCAAYENEQGRPVAWDDLPAEAKEAHRLVAAAVVGAAVAHNPPPKTPLVRV